MEEKQPLLVNKQQNRVIGLGYITASAFAFSLMSCAVKFESATLSSMQSVFWRSIVSWLICAASMLATKRSFVVAPEFHFFLGVRCIMGFCSMALGFWAISQMTLPDATALLFTSPIFAFFLGVLLLQEAFDKVTLFFALLAFSGVLFVARPPIIFGNGAPVSIFCINGALLAAICKSLGFVAVRKIKHLDFLVGIFWLFLSCVITSALWLWLISSEGIIWPTETSVQLAAVATGILGFAAQMFLVRGFQLEKVGKASAMRYLDIVFVFIWEATLLHEPINQWSVVGAVIITVSAIGITLRKAKVI
ncbi:Drug/Metabolite Transporter (DMT) Superfamily [Thraustotheca clavata]|uniref:Drug/Metabolite Transporter (DMT) Superfamily n=1 Tax=Thraustotheca clavata TaxID=74557 RepID=A0A1W0A0I7_9STRA|nr:Drug/Metabolite Transporter (DMT) Superfamily [Thraustotheca clavata]